MSPQRQPIIALFDVPNMNQAQYDGIIRGLEAAGVGRMPERLYHVTGPNGDGWIVVDVWTSAEDFTQFAGTLMPIVQQTGVTPPQPRVFPVYTIIDGTDQVSARANLAVIEKAQQQFNAGDVNGYIETLYTPDTTFHYFPPGLPRGQAGAKIFYGGFMAAFPDAKITFDDLLAQDDKIILRYHLDMTHEGEFQGIQATGKQVTLKGITILRFANGKVVERWNEGDFVGLMMQLGAIPTPEQIA